MKKGYGGNNNKKKSKRLRNEIGKTGATDAIRHYDRKQAAREHYMKMTTEYKKENGANARYTPPPVEDFERHYKSDPNNPRQLLCNKHSDKYRIVLSMGTLSETIMQEFTSRKWASYQSFRAYMVDKYYLDEKFMDSMFKGLGNAKSNDEEGSRDERN